MFIHKCLISLVGLTASVSYAGNYADCVDAALAGMSASTESEYRKVIINHGHPRLLDFAITGSADAVKAAVESLTHLCSDEVMSEGPHTLSVYAAESALELELKRRQAGLN